MKQALYIQPMTARDAAFAEGRKAGLQEAAEHLEAMGRTYYLTEPIYRGAAAELRSLAGEP